MKASTLCHGKTLVVKFAVDFILCSIQMHVVYQVSNIQELMFPKYLPGVGCSSRIKRRARYLTEHNLSEEVQMSTLTSDK